jgi:hypothetical protein
MEIATVGVALPDFDRGVRDRPPVHPQHPAPNVSDDAFRPRRGAAQHDEVAVHVAREGHRIKRSGGLGRRRHEPGGLGAQAGRQDERPGGGEAAGDHPAPAELGSG